MSPRTRTKVSAPNIRSSPITRQKWEELLALYRDRPTISNLCKYGNVGEGVARRAINIGWPEIGLPPFTSVFSPQQTVAREILKMNNDWNDGLPEKNERTRRSAEQARAARVSMDAAFQASRMTQSYAAAIIEKMADGSAVLPPEVTPKLISMLVKTLENANAVMQKAVAIDKEQAPAEESALGMHLGSLLDRCSDEELDSIISSGELPMRILDQRYSLLEKLAEQSDAETRAQAAIRANIVPDIAEEELEKEFQSVRSQTNIRDGEEAATDPLIWSDSDEDTGNTDTDTNL